MKSRKKKSKLIPFKKQLNNSSKLLVHCNNNSSVFKIKMLRLKDWGQQFKHCMRRIRIYIQISQVLYHLISRLIIISTTAMLIWMVMFKAQKGKAIIAI